MIIDSAQTASWSAPPRASKRRSYRPPRSLPHATLIGPLLVLAAWALASGSGWLDPHTLSAPWKVFAAAASLWQSGKLQAHLITSLWRALLGLSLGVTLGGSLALFSGLTRTGEALIDGTLQVKRSLPNVALIPLLILWLGIGETMKVATIALGATVPIYIHTHAALRGIDNRYVELARTLRLRRTELVTKVALPGALPGFLMGLRLAFTASWVSLVVVEQVNATSGVGYMMSLARSYGQTEIILLGLVIYALLGLGSDALVRALERRALTWRRTLAG